MRLRTRTLLTVMGLMLGAAVATELAGRLLIYPKFVELEAEQAQHNAERVVAVMNRELQLLAPSVEDWAYWDDTFAFVTDRNQEFVDSNLDPDTLASLRINLFAFYDREGAAVWVRGLDPKTGEPLRLAEFGDQGLAADHPLRAREDVATLRSGLMPTSHGPMLVASAPILDSARQGGHRGTLVMGRFFDTEALNRIARQTLLRVELSRATGTTPIAALDDRGVRIRHSPIELTTSDDTLTASTTLVGLDGLPVMDLRIHTPRDVSQRGGAALRLALACVGVSGLVTAGILLWLLNAGIVTPLTAMTAMARSVSAEPELDARLRMGRDDELGELADEFDSMLDHLAETRRQLLDQSYRAGASEMASGVINDLQQSIGPLKEHIDQPARLLDRAQSAGLQMLLHQLADPALARPKQSELMQLLQEHIGEQASTLSEARAELRSLRRQFDQLQEVVSEYGRFAGGSGAALVALRLPPMLAQAQRLLPPPLQHALHLECDPGLEQVEAVRAPRDALQQVVNQLVQRAAIALRDSPAGNGSLRVGVDLAGSRGSLVHFRFDDDRPALAPEALEQLFEPDPDHPGQDLSWARGVVTGLGGQLYASRSQPYDGLVINLLLPKARV